MRIELMAYLSEDHFSTASSIEIFSRCLSLMKMKGFMPTWRDLSADPAIGKSTRRIIKDKNKLKGFQNEDDMRSALSTLESLRKIRGLINLGSNLQGILEDRTIDVDKAISQLIQDTSRVTDVAEDSIIHHVGLDDNSIHVVRDLLKKGGVPKLPTGIRGYDEPNVGFPEGCLVLLASTTSGGKSTVINQMAENFAMQGARTLTIPLEMSNEENLQRVVSRVTDANMHTLLDPSERMTEEQRKAAYMRYKEYSKKIAKRGGRMTFLEPRFPPTMEKLLNFVKPMDPDVIFLDYVGLLDGLDGNDQWLQLSNALSYAKRWSGLNKKRVVVAAQLSDDGMIRYSRAMKEHASHMWQWVMTEKSRESGIVKVEQTKCRNGNMIPFLLKFDFENMTVRDVNDKERIEYEESTKPGKGKKSGTWGTKSSDYDYEEEDKPKDKKKPKSKRGKKKGRSDDFDKDFSY